MSAATTFLSVLFAGQTGVLELRACGPEASNTSPDAVRQRRRAYRLRDFVPVVNGQFDAGRVDRFVSACNRAKLPAYFGVALRSSSALMDRKGDRTHCQTLTALIGDVDFKYLGETETRRWLAAFPEPPAIVVFTGGGLHLYWLLLTALDLLTQYDEARELLRRRAYRLADVADTDVVSEPARVLRLPGSLNFKYDPPREVRIERLTDHRSDAADPDGLPLVAASGVPSGEPLRLPDQIAVGDRHALLRNTMRSLQARGVPLEGALAACRIENRAKCRPPLDPHALDAYLRRVASLPDRRGFTRTPLTGWELTARLLDVGLSVDATLVAVRSVTPDFDPELS